MRIFRKSPESLNQDPLDDVRRCADVTELKARPRNVRKGLESFQPWVVGVKDSHANFPEIA